MRFTLEIASMQDFLLRIEIMEKVKIVFGLLNWSLVDTDILILFKQVHDTNCDIFIKAFFGRYGELHHFYYYYYWVVFPN